MDGGGSTWFAVVPDHDNAAAVATGLARYAQRRIAYPSGRPWLVGSWLPGEVTCSSVAGPHVAVIGQCPVTTAELDRHAGRGRGIEDFDVLARTLSGSFSLVAIAGDKIRAQGSASGLRQMFHSVVGGVTVVSDRADVLAELNGAAVDEQRLCTAMLYPCVPQPLAAAPPWRGVDMVPSGCYVTVAPGVPARIVRWWTPPEPSRSLPEGAPALLEALTAAVRARVTRGGQASADLSGGLDSTSLCFLAARLDARLATATFGSADPCNDDMRWARFAADHLAEFGVTEVDMLDHDQVPQPYEDMVIGAEAADGPFDAFRNCARQVFLVRRMVHGGARVHFSGLGGDEVVQAAPAYLHTLARHSPAAAISHMRGFAARYRYPVSRGLRALSDRRPYRTWLARAAQDLSGPPLNGEEPHYWESPSRLPPWATPAAHQAAREMVLRAAENAEPLDLRRGQHESLTVIRQSAAQYRHVAQVTRRAGADLALPFLDDRVIEACLAVRLEERTSPWRYKPLLTSAMRGVVPSDLLGRTTKGHMAAETYAGLRAARRELAELVDDSLLARLGLVEAEPLRTACLGLYPPGLSLAALDKTLACELWLRQVAAAPRVSMDH